MQREVENNVQREAENKSSKEFNDSDGESLHIILPRITNKITLDCLAKILRDVDCCTHHEGEGL